MSWRTILVYPSSWRLFKVINLGNNRAFWYFWVFEERHYWFRKIILNLFLCQCIFDILYKFRKEWFIAFNLFINFIIIKRVIWEIRDIFNAKIQGFIFKLINSYLSISMINLVFIFYISLTSYWVYELSVSFCSINWVIKCLKFYKKIFIKEK